MDAQKDAFHAAVGRALVRQRDLAGVSITDLAQRVGVKLSSIQKAEEGLCCSLFLLAKIAHELDITLDDLVPVDALH